MSQTVLTFNKFRNQNIIKNLILVHPNPQSLERLRTSLEREGHLVYAFQKVDDANHKIHSMLTSGRTIDRVIVPKNLRVYYGFTYKSFLHRMFPECPVLTVDSKEYRDPIDVNLSKFDYICSILTKEKKNVAR